MAYILKSTRVVEGETGRQGPTWDGQIDFQSPVQIGERTISIGPGYAGTIARAALERYGVLLNDVYVKNGTYNPGDWHAAAGLTIIRDQIYVPQGVTFFLGFSRDRRSNELPGELKGLKVEGGLRTFQFEDPNKCYNFNQINLQHQLTIHGRSSFTTLAHRLWRTPLHLDPRAMDSLHQVEQMTYTGDVVFNAEGYLEALKNHTAGVEIGKYVRRRIDSSRYPGFMKGAVNLLDDLRSYLQFKPAMDEALPHFGAAVENGGNMFTSLTTIQLAKRFLIQMKELFPNDKWIKYITFVDPKHVKETAFSGRAPTYFEKMLVVITGFKRD